MLGSGYLTNFGVLFEVTEAKAIAKAQNIIDLELEKVGME